MKKQMNTPAQIKRNVFVPSWFSSAFIGACSLIMISCGGEKHEEAESTSEQPKVELADDPNKPAEDNGLGVGPVKSVEVAGLDPKLATTGKSLFEAKCSACHQVTDQKVVGPGLKGVTERRKPEWIMNMILNPAEMTQKDPTAKKLLAEHLTQMTNQNVEQKDARAILEYFRQNDGAK